MAVAEYTWNPLTDSVIEETDGAGNVLVEYTNEPAPYGPLISERRGSDTRQYHFDALGSTRALTDDSQAITDTFSYDAWGKVVSRIGQSPSPLLWVGKVGYHHSPGQYSVRRRIYSATLSRWRSYDHVVANISRYRYSSNSPVLRSDPTGMDEVVIGRWKTNLVLVSQLKDKEPAFLFVWEYILDPLPEPDAAQYWQINFSIAYRLFSDCTSSIESNIVLDIMPINRMPIPGVLVDWYSGADQQFFVQFGDVCFMSVFVTVIAGINGENDRVYPEVPNQELSDGSTNIIPSMVARMREPFAFGFTYTYTNPANCCKCLPALPKCCDPPTECLALPWGTFCNENYPAV